MSADVTDSESEHYHSSQTGGRNGQLRKTTSVSSLSIYSTSQVSENQGLKSQGSFGGSLLQLLKMNAVRSRRGRVSPRVLVRVGVKLYDFSVQIFYWERPYITLLFGLAWSVIALNCSLVLTMAPLGIAGLFTCGFMYWHPQSPFPTSLKRKINLEKYAKKYHPSNASAGVIESAIDGTRLMADVVDFATRFPALLYDLITWRDIEKSTIVGAFSLFATVSWFLSLFAFGMPVTVCLLGWCILLSTTHGGSSALSSISELIARHVAPLGYRVDVIFAFQTPESMDCNFVNEIAPELPHDGFVPGLLFEDVDDSCFGLSIVAQNEILSCYVEKQCSRIVWNWTSSGWYDATADDCFKSSANINISSMNSRASNRQVRVWTRAAHCVML